MKTIIRVAKTELRTLFYSPIAWFLMIVFLIQCGIVYVGALNSIARTQEMGGFSLQYLARLTSRIFLGQSGLFSEVMQKLYLYIPLLTMGLISRETSSGTIKLLYSSPIKVREIVFGKFLSMMVYSLLLVAIVGIFIVSGLFHVQFPETRMLMTAALGFYLLLCAYSAIGLFMSSLTTYQVVAAVCTFVMIGILSYIGTLWQGIDFVRNLTYFLSISGRTEKMLGGLITTKDVIYFIVIVYIFLGLTIYKLKAGMESKPASVKAARYIAIVASALLIGYVTSIPGFIGYYDATNNKSRTLTPNAQKIIAELGDEPLEVTAYNNLLGRYWFLGTPESYNQNLARWEPYMRFKTNIELKTVRYYDSAYDNPYMFRGYPGKSVKEIAEQYAKSMDIKLAGLKTPEEMRKIIDLRPEMNRFVMQLKYKNRTTFLRVFDDQQMWPSETEVSAAFKRLLQAKLPKIAFLTGDLERDIDKMGDREYKALTNLSTFRNSLMNQGFDVDSLSLETQDIPADISTLVIADPKVELSPATMAKLQKYIDNGGNLMIAGEPNKQSVLNPLLKQLGVQLSDGIVVQESKDFSPDLVTPLLTKLAGGFSKPLAKSFADSQRVSMPGAVGITYENGGAFKIEPLLMTDASLTWNRKQKLDLEMMTSADASKQNAPAMAPPVQNMGSNKKVSVRPMGSVVTTGTIHRPDSARMNRPMREMPPEVKKRMDSVRSAMSAIMNGEGTKEEKQKKMGELMSGLARQNAASRPAMTNGQPSAPVKISTTPVTKPAATVTMSAAPVQTMVVSSAGGGMSMSMASGSDRRSPAAGTVRFSAADGDVRGPITTLVSLTRKVNGKEQRIIVSGDADFMSNSELQRNNIRTANFIFNTALFSWLSYGEFPIDTSRPDSKDNRVNVTTDQVDFLKIIYLWVLPAILIAFGTILLIRRKRK